MPDIDDQRKSDPWTRYMLQGDFASAWEVSDNVLHERAGKPCMHLPRHLQYCWDGSSLNDKRVLVRCYHGLGDTIQFIRYMPLLKQIAGEVIVWAQESLLPLLETIEGIDKLLPLHDGAPEVEYDTDIELMELPHIFRTTIGTIPTRIPYLFTEPKSLPLRQGLAVGLVWRAGDWDESRCIPFSVLEPLSKLTGITFYILQFNARVAGWDESFGEYIGEFDVPEFAGVMKSLDLLITVDSMPAHLAGALGVPVWTLLQKHADWRWMEDREDSPWYPTMRLFRQKEQGEWKEVIERVKEELKSFTPRSFSAPEAYQQTF
jgi:hypothetical protein